MIATYLLLNYPEKDLLNWRNMQALLGKTGKDGLKRQVTSLDPLHVDMAKADFAFDKYLKETDLETIRDVSAGAATFYVWVSRWEICFITLFLKNRYHSPAVKRLCNKFFNPLLGTLYIFCYFKGDFIMILVLKI